MFTITDYSNLKQLSYGSMHRSIYHNLHATDCKLVETLNQNENRFRSVHCFVLYSSVVVLYFHFITT